MSTQPMECNFVGERTSLTMACNNCYYGGEIQMEKTIGKQLRAAEDDVGEI